MRPGRTAVAAALLCAAVLAGPALAQDEFSPFGDPDRRQEQLEPPPSLPEGLRGLVRPRADAEPLRRVNTIRDVFLAIQACWYKPLGSGFSGQELTLRMSFKRNGEVLGQPRITYYRAGGEADERAAFTNSVREAFVRCSPLPVSETLGAAIAGRPFVFRFVDSKPL